VNSVSKIGRPSAIIGTSSETAVEAFCWRAPVSDIVART
jgi:hypothetical protein